MKKFVVIILFMPLVMGAFNRKHISIEKAAKLGYITVEAKGKGGYSGYCVQLKITNKCKDSIYIDLEAGRRLKSADPEEQDILVTKEQVIKMRSTETRNVDVYGFCCQASNHAPKKESKFYLGKMADSSLAALAKYCDKNRFSQNDIQSSVWCLSDDHSVSSIPANNERLRKYVADVKKEDIPWYQTEFEPGNETRAFSNKTNKISGNITYTMPAPSIMKIQLVDANNNLMQTFTHEKPTPKGTFDYWFELQVTNWPKGKYFINIYSGTELVTKREFVI